MNSLSVLLFARNEERGLARRLEAVAAISPARIVIVDAFSTDRTVEVAQAAGAEVIQRQFVEASSQFQWACDAARISTDWVMALDVNEWLEPGLAAEIAATLPTLGPEISGVRLQLRRTFLGRAIRYGGRGPRSRLRIWRAGLKPFGLPSSDGQCVSRARTVSLVSTPAEFFDIAQTNGWLRASKSCVRHLLFERSARRAFLAQIHAETPSFVFDKKRLVVGNAVLPETWNR